MEFIPLQSYDNYVEAHMAMGNLRHEHINCWLKDEFMVTIDPLLSNAIGGIKLMVAEVQVERAVEILQQTAGNKQHYVCPDCGSRAIRLVNQVPQSGGLLKQLWYAVFNHNNTARNVWHCETCGNDSKEPRIVKTDDTKNA